MLYEIFVGEYPVIYVQEAESHLRGPQLTDRLREIAGQRSLDVKRLIILHHSPQHTHPSSFVLEEAWYLGGFGALLEQVESRVALALLGRCRELAAAKTQAGGKGKPEQY